MQAQAAAIDEESTDQKLAIDPDSPFEFQHKPSPGSRVEKIVHRMERGELDLEQASSLLMDEFRKRRDIEAYSALYDLNWRRFLGIIRKRLAGYRNRISAADVLQEIFLLIYRYPRRFRNEHRNSFRNWSYSIIINSIRRKISKAGMITVDLMTIAETHTDGEKAVPLNRLIVAEDVVRLKRLYSFSLMLYMNAYRSRLNKTERDALHLIEVLRVPYREAAEKLGIKYDNFKMMICRARRKIASAIAGYVKLASETSMARQTRAVQS